MDPLARQGLKVLPALPDPLAHKVILGQQDPQEPKVLPDPRGRKA